jgi:hypothetical protein
VKWVKTSERLPSESDMYFAADMFHILAGDLNGGERGTAGSVGVIVGETADEVREALANPEFPDDPGGHWWSSIDPPPREPE